VACLAAALFLGVPIAAHTSDSTEPDRLTHDGARKLTPVFVAHGDAIVFAMHERPNLVALMRLRLKDGARERVHPTVASHQFDPAYSEDEKIHVYSRTATSPQSVLVIKEAREPKEFVFRPRDSRATARSPSVAPNGQRIAFSVSDVGGQQIASVNLKGEDLKILAPSAGINGWPAYSPDGRHIAFASSRDGDFEIYVMSTDGENLRRLTHSRGRDLRPAWSPDGQRIAFTSSRDGNEEIYVMAADGAHPRNLTHHPDRDDFPAWHPDGRHLVFVSERDGGSDLYRLDATR
jgi:TolB protein